MPQCRLLPTSAAARLPFACPPPPQPLPLGRHAAWSSQLGVPGQGQDWERREGSPDPAVLQFNPGRWKRSREGHGRCGAVQPGGQCLSQSDLASRAGSATKSHAEGTLSGPQFSHLHNGNKSSAHFKQKCSFFGSTFRVSDLLGLSKLKICIFNRLLR